MIEGVNLPAGELGKWRVDKLVIGDKESKRSRLDAMMHGRGYVPPGCYTQLTCKGRGIVMTDTPDERRDHYEPVRRARGHLLINGLGIGMILNAALRKIEVSAVTVVEIDREVIDLVGPHYRDPRVTIVHASAFDYQPPKGVRYGAVWHDIWDAICADNLPEMTRLKRKYGRRCDWQGCWAEYECRRNRGW